MHLMLTSTRPELPAIQHHITQHERLRFATHLARKKTFARVYRIANFVGKSQNTLACICGQVTVASSDQQTMLTASWQETDCSCSWARTHQQSKKEAHAQADAKTIYTLQLAAGLAI